MSARMLTKAFNTQLPPKEKLVLLVLGDWANWRGEVEFRTEEITSTAGIDSSEVQLIKRRLVEKDVLEVLNWTFEDSDHEVVRILV